MRVTLGRHVAAQLRGRPRLLFFDIDGTLAPIAHRPDAARIPAITCAALARLAGEEGTHVALVSGRSSGDARGLLPDVRAWVVGNHGMEILDPDGALSVNPAVEPFRAMVAHAASELAAVSARFPGTVLEDKTWTLSLHYRLASAGTAAPLRQEVERVAVANGLRFTEGKMVYELRPPVPIDKGTAVVALARSLGGFERGATILYAGDDNTDEDAFIALARDAPHAVTVRVSDAAPDVLQTAATMVARDPAALGSFLDWLARAPTVGDAR